MERKIRWDLSNERFKEIKEVLRTNELIISDFVGSVEVGELSVEFVFRDYDDKIELDYDVFVGGVDSGYGYTLDKELPYDYADGGVLDKDIIENLKTIEEFKEYALKVAEEYIANKDYNVNGITLLTKADSQKFFKWD